METGSCSDFFHARFRSEHCSAGTHIALTAALFPCTAAVLALAFGLLPTPAAVERLARGPLFNFKAAYIGAAIIAPLGIGLGLWGAKRQLDDNSRSQPPEMSARAEVGYACMGIGLNVVLLLIASAATISARRWGNPAVIAGTSGVVAALYSFGCSLDMSSTAALLVWPYPTPEPSVV